MHLLGSAASVTPGEYRRAKRTGGVASLFLISIPKLTRKLDAVPAPPDRRHWRAFTDIAPSAIRTWDRYGSYPPNRYLCHGAIWKAAIDELLRHVDLVVLDLSGFTSKNLGTEYELQRVIDRFPVERTVFLADPRSKRKFLEEQIQVAWRRMAAGSPNSGTEPRTAYVTVTDRYRLIQRPPVQVPGPRPGQFVTQQQGPPQLRLVARRRQTRRLAAAFQNQAALPSRPVAGAPAAVSPATVTPATVTPATVTPATVTPATISPATISPDPGPRAPKLIALAGAIVYLVSATLLTHYIDNGTGPKSLYQATNGDPASPLSPRHFMTLAALLAATAALAATSLVTARRWAIAGATATALVLAAYTLYLPSVNSDGFGPYGSSYWISLAAAAVMALAAGASAIR